MLKNNSDDHFTFVVTMLGNSEENKFCFSSGLTACFHHDSNNGSFLSERSFLFQISSYLTEMLLAYTKESYLRDPTSE